MCMLLTLSLFTFISYFLQILFLDFHFDGWSSFFSFFCFFRHFHLCFLRFGLFSCHCFSTHKLLNWRHTFWIQKWIAYCVLTVANKQFTSSTRHLPLQPLLCACFVLFYGSCIQKWSRVWQSWWKLFINQK